MKVLQENFILEEQKLTEKNLTENSNGKQEQIDDNVVVQQIDIADAMNEDPMFRLKVINKALVRENKHLKEQIKIMGEAQVNKAIKEESNATNG